MSLHIEIDDLSDATPITKMEEPIVVEISEQTKTINLFEDVPVPKKASFDKLNVKDLKDLVAKHGGPVLKTKKEMVEFLEKI
jgi:hypothetical protein